jgi:hypothetical protein
VCRAPSGGSPAGLGAADADCRGLAQVHARDQVKRLAQAVVPHHVNYAFAAESLGDELVAEAFAGLRNPEKGEPYELVSLSAVQNGLHPWAPRDASKLFGYGCDLILRSPDPMVEDDEAVDAE